MITNKRLAEIKARHDASRLGEWGDLTAFLAHAHQDVPALVAEVERLRAEAQVKRTSPLWCRLPSGSDDGTPCPAGCKDVCASVYDRKSDALKAAVEWEHLEGDFVNARMVGLQADVERLREALGKVEQTANHGVNHPNEALALCHQFAAAAPITTTVCK